jgi:hypothetical protein
MIEYATLPAILEGRDGNRAAFNEYVRLRQACPRCTRCGDSRPVRFQRVNGKAVGLCQSCARGADRLHELPALRPTSRSARPRFRSDAERLAKLRELQRSIAPMRLRLAPLSELDDARLARLRRLQAGQ